MNESNWLCRTELLLGGESLERLRKAHVLIAGLGGVGAYAAEQLTRAGIGKFTLVDCDVVQPSNRNRQLIALTSTEGRQKTELVAGRIRDINPECEVKIIDEFLSSENIPLVLAEKYAYVIDAIDTLTPKVDLLEEAVKRELCIISSFGSGGKMDPSQVRISRMEDSFGCKFGYMIRKALHKRKVYEGLKVVFSPEKVDPESIMVTDGSGNKRSVVGTISYMPAVFGCFCAAEVIRDLIKKIPA
ncbi:MAG: tRNA threonylcarbamoyladenosine dehydratase [Bacteroidales bacterium]|nr:tRNA threonylcarbamoyladenosine dehydratase [Bacteroidales bacterium]